MQSGPTNISGTKNECLVPHMGRCCYVCLLLLAILGAFQPAKAQEAAEDTSDARRPFFDNNIFKFAMNAITRNGDDDSTTDVLKTKSESPFQRFDGKIIRYVRTEKFGFEKTFTDTANRIKYFGTRALNALHRDTRDWVIRDNLFFREGDSLDAYLMADNERYLRTLEFLQDARILVTPVRGTDSVDIVVITKDVFSISGRLSQLTTERFRGRVSDANLFGMGQKLQVAVLWEKKRQPVIGYDLRYIKNNIAGTFINGTIGYTTINSTLLSNTQSEHGWYIGLDRPLPYASAKYAGGLEVNSYESKNNYDKPDSLFYNYKVRTYDVWAGHNINARNVLRDASRPNRFFISGRYLNRTFTQVPYQFVDSFQFDFNTRQAVLGQFTFFRQRFYKTNYILNFGNTEDAPYGYNISLVGGWYKQLYLSRAYAGIDANRYMVTRRGALIQYYVRAGGFLNKGDVEDLGVLAGSSVYSPLFLVRNMKIRQYVNVSYTELYNRRGLFPLRIDNDFGLQSFNARDLFGKRRVTLKSETSFYVPGKLLGFKFAPFMFAQGSLLKPEKNFPDQKTKLYYGIGGGVRTRNQNLVFGTIELRAIYFPKTTGGNGEFKIGINTNIRFRINSNYVYKPDIIQLNSDVNNMIN